MTATFDRAGLRFLYPENWTVSDEQLSSTPQSLTVESPGSGFWVLMVYDREFDPEQLVEQVVESMREEYEGLETALAANQFGEVQVGGCDMMFYCLDFVVHSRVLALRALGRTLLTMWQAEDREFESLEPVFLAITKSLLEPEKIAQQD